MSTHPAGGRHERPQRQRPEQGRWPVPHVAVPHVQVPHLPVPPLPARVEELPSRLGPAGVALGAAAGALAAGVAVGVAVQRAGLRVAGNDVLPGTGDTPLGGLRGREWTVTTDDGVRLQLSQDDGPDTPDTPDGEPTLLFVHGFALDTDIWSLQRAALRGRRRMVFLDQRGHGRSGTPPPGSATIDRLGRDLGEVLDALAAAEPGRPVVLVGHSMGGMAVLALAGQRPDLFGTRITGVALVCSSPGDAPPAAARRIAAIGPLDALSSAAVALSRGATRASHRLTNSVLYAAGQVPGLTGRARGAIRPVEAAITRRASFAAPVPDAVAAFAGRVIAGTPVAVIAAFYLSFFDLDLLPQVAVLRRVASLVVSGEADRVTPAWHSEQIADRLPDARVVRFAPAGHMVFLEYPARVTALIEELAERAAARGTG